MLSGIRDIDLKIFSYLEDNDIWKVSLLNKYFNGIYNDENFWLNRLLKKDRYDLEELKNIKGEFTYKEIYKYIYFDYNNGLLEAAKYDNLYLLKEIINIKDIQKIDNKIIILAAKNNSYEILTFMFLDNRSLTSELVERIYCTGNEETIEWIFKMNISSYPEYIDFLIYSRCKEENLQNLYRELKKYLIRIAKRFSKDEFPSEFMNNLGYSLTVLDLESRKEIFKIMLSIFKEIDLEYCIALAIQGAENVEIKKRNEWIKFLN